MLYLFTAILKNIVLVLTEIIVVEHAVDAESVGRNISLDGLT